MAEILLNRKDKEDADKLVQLLYELTKEEKKEMLLFMQGIRFAKGIKQKIAGGTEKVV